MLLLVVSLFLSLFLMGGQLQQPKHFSQIMVLRVVLLVLLGYHECKRGVSALHAQPEVQERQVQAHELLQGLIHAYVHIEGMNEPQQSRRPLEVKQCVFAFHLMHGSFIVPGGARFPVAVLFLFLRGELHVVLLATQSLLLLQLDTVARASARVEAIGLFLLEQAGLEGSEHVLGAGEDELLATAEKGALETGDAGLLGEVVLVEVRLVEEVVAEVALIQSFEHFLLRFFALRVCVQGIFESEKGRQGYGVLGVVACVNGVGVVEHGHVEGEREEIQDLMGAQAHQRRLLLEYLLEAVELQHILAGKGESEAVIPGGKVVQGLLHHEHLGGEAEVRPALQHQGLLVVEEHVHAFSQHIVLVLVRHTVDAESRRVQA